MKFPRLFPRKVRRQAPFTEPSFRQLSEEERWQLVRHVQDYPYAWTETKWPQVGR